MNRTDFGREFDDDSAPAAPCNEVRLLAVLEEEIAARRGAARNWSGFRPLFPTMSAVIRMDNRCKCQEPPSAAVPAPLGAVHAGT